MKIDPSGNLSQIQTTQTETAQKISSPSTGDLQTEKSRSESSRGISDTPDGIERAVDSTFEGLAAGGSTEIGTVATESHSTDLGNLMTEFFTGGTAAEQESHALGALSTEGNDSGINTGESSVASHELGVDDGEVSVATHDFGIDAGELATESHALGVDAGEVATEGPDSATGASGSSSSDGTTISSGDDTHDVSGAEGGSGEDVDPNMINYSDYANDPVGRLAMQSLTNYGSRAQGAVDPGFVDPGENQTSIGYSQTPETKGSVRVDQSDLQNIRGGTYVPASSTFRITDPGYDPEGSSGFAGLIEGTAGALAAQFLGDLSILGNANAGQIQVPTVRPDAAETLQSQGGPTDASVGDE